MTDRELMQQALEALGWTDEWRPDGLKEQAIAALRERLAQPEQPSVPWSAALESVWGEPEQKPVAWMHNDIRGNVITHRPADLARHPERWTPLYTTPPQRKPLLASDIVTMYDENPRSDSEMIAFARAIEAAHGIKGEA